MKDYLFSVHMESSVQQKARQIHVYAETLGDALKLLAERWLDDNDSIEWNIQLMLVRPVEKVQ